MSHSVYDLDSVKFRTNAFPSQGTYRLKDPTGAPCVEFQLPSRKVEYEKLWTALRLTATAGQSGVLVSGDYGAGKTAVLGALHELGPSVAGLNLGDQFMSVFYDCAMASPVPELAIYHLVEGLVEEVVQAAGERLRSRGWSESDISQKLAELRNAIRNIQNKEYAPEWYLVLQGDHLGNELLGELISRHDAFTSEEFGRHRQPAKADELRETVVQSAVRIVQHLETLRRQEGLQDALPSTDEVVQHARPQTSERPSPTRSFKVFDYVVRWVLGDTNLEVDHLHLYLDEVEKVINRVSPENRNAIARFFQDILDLREALPDGKHLFIAMAMTPAAVHDLFRAAPALRGRRLLPTINVDPLTLEDLVVVVKRHLQATLKDGHRLANMEPFTLEAINTAYRYGNAVLGNALRLLHVGMQAWYEGGHDDGSPGKIGADDFFEALKGVGIVVPALDRALRSYRANERRLLAYVIAHPTFNHDISVNSDDEILDEEAHAFRLHDLVDRFQMTVDEVETLLERVARDPRLPGLLVRGGSQHQYVWASMKALHEGFLHILQRSDSQVIPLETQWKQRQPQDPAQAVHQQTAQTLARSVSQELRDAARGDRLHAASSDYERGLLRLIRYRWHSSNALRALSLESESSWISVASRIRAAGVPHADAMLDSSGPVGDVVLCNLVPNQRTGNQESASELIHPKASVLLLPLRAVGGEKGTLALPYFEFVKGSLQALRDKFDPDIPTVAITLLPAGHYEVTAELQQRLEATPAGAPPWVRHRHQMPFLTLRVDEMFNYENLDRHMKVWIAYLGGLEFDIDSLGDERKRNEFLADTRPLWGHPALREVDTVIAICSETLAARIPFLPVRNGFLREGQTVAEAQVGRSKLEEPVMRACLAALTEDRRATLHELQVRARDLFAPNKEASYVKNHVDVAITYLFWAGLVKKPDLETITLERNGAQQLVDILPVNFEAGNWGQLIPGVEIPARRKADLMLEQLLAVLVSHNHLTLDKGQYRRATKSFAELQAAMLSHVDSLKEALAACDLLGVALGVHEQGWDRMAELTAPLGEHDITELREVHNAIQRSLAQLNRKLGSWEVPLAALASLTSLDTISKPAQAFTLLTGLAPFRHLLAAVNAVQDQPPVDEQLGLATAAGYYVLKAVPEGLQYATLVEELRSRARSDLTPLNLIRLQPSGCAPPAAAGLSWGPNEVDTFVHQLGETETKLGKRGIGTLSEVVDRAWDVGISLLAGLLDAVRQAIGAMTDTTENKERLEQAAPSTGTLMKSLEQAKVRITSSAAASSWVANLAADADLEQFKELAGLIRDSNLNPNLLGYSLDPNGHAAARGDAMQAAAALKQIWSELATGLDGSRWHVAGPSELYARAVGYAAVRAWARDGWLVKVLGEDQRRALGSCPDFGTTAAARELAQQVRTSLARTVPLLGNDSGARSRAFRSQLEVVLAARAALEHGLIAEVDVLIQQHTQLIDRCEGRIRAIQNLKGPDTLLMTRLNTLRLNAISQSSLLAIPQLQTAATRLQTFFERYLWEALREAVAESVPKGDELLERVTHPDFDIATLDSDDLKRFAQLRELALVQPVTVWKVV